MTESRCQTMVRMACAHRFKICSDCHAPIGSLWHSPLRRFPYKCLSIEQRYRYLGADCFRNTRRVLLSLLPEIPSILAQKTVGSYICPYTICSFARNLQSHLYYTSLTSQSSKGSHLCNASILYTRLYNYKALFLGEKR